LIFQDQTLEKVFRDSHDNELRILLRSGIIQSIFSWSFGLVLVYVIIPEYFLKFSLIVLGGIFVPFLIILSSTYKEKFIGYFQELAAISNIIAGLMTIYFCHHFSDGVFIMLPVLILVVFFGNYLYRFRILMGAFVTFTYIASFQLYILFFIELEFSQALLLSSIAWLTMVFSISLGFVYEKNHRNSFIQQQTIRQQKIIIEKEKEQSERLLLNILPLKVAEELKNTGRAKPRRYENVTILFTDFQGFTELVTSISEITLEQELNDIFSNFDDIMDDEGIEKIKTIGDSYLAAGGLPEETHDHAQKCISAAKRMIDFLDQRNAQNTINWKMRIGIHSGPIVAGVVGKKKFAYDLFGDTINTASRIETSGEPGRINISASTYELIKDEIICIPRGKIPAKGKGVIDMYFVR
jgi:class 3 adenylate cyclase